MRAALFGFGIFGLLVSTSSFADTCKDDDANDNKIEGPAPGHDQMTLTKAKFSDLPGWTDDKLAEAVPSFLNSCARLAELKDADPVGVDGHGGTAKQWRSACAAAAKLKAGDNAAARTLFETEFV
ncbi:MAG: hypothetical protein ABI591_33870, partial [Kofleriaceae bacterium]